MSQAFVRENDEQWLHEIAPTMNALIVYLTRENNGIRVYEQKNYPDPKTGKEIHAMSNGLSYTKDAEGKWCIV
jgi:GTP cyclohydrolase II